MMTKTNGGVWVPPSSLFKLPPELRARAEALLAKPMDATAYAESEALGIDLQNFFHPHVPYLGQMESDDGLLMDRIVAARDKYVADADNQKLYFEKLQAGMAMALEAAHFLGGHLQISYQPKKNVEPKEP